MARYKEVCLDKIDREYNFVRSSLVGAAFSLTAKKYGERPDKKTDTIAHTAWNQKFLQNMDTLMKLRRKCPVCGCPVEPGVNI